MTSYQPPKRATEYIFYVTLDSSPGVFQVNPTLAAGDVQVSTDGGAFTNLDTLPAVTPAGGVTVKVTLSVAEMTGDNVMVTFIDAAGSEWLSDSVNLQPSVAQLDDLVADIWNEVLTGGTYNITSSAGKRLRDTASTVFQSGTCSSGSTVNTVVLNGLASAVDGSYDPSLITITAGTGQGQTRLIFEYDGGTKTAVVDRNWKVTPADDSEYIIFGHPGREHVNEGLARGGDTNKITLNALASDQNDIYSGQLVFIRSGVGEDQIGLVIAYNGTTKVATVEEDWNIQPDATSGYAMLPHHDHPVSEMAAEFLSGTIMAELTAVADIPATPTVAQALMLLYMAMRNDSQATSGERRVLNDAGTEILDAAMTEDGTTFSQGKLTDA